MLNSELLNERMLNEGARRDELPVPTPILSAIQAGDKIHLSWIYE